MDIERVYRLQSELMCVFMNARPNTYGPIPEDALCVAILASLANLQFGNRRMDQWIDIRNLANDAIAMLSNTTPSMFSEIGGASSVTMGKAPIASEQKLPVRAVGSLVSSVEAGAAHALAGMLRGMTLRKFDWEDDAIIEQARDNPKSLSYGQFHRLMSISHSL